MSSEKTEQPTAKRRDEALRKGDIAHSRDLQGALMLLVALCALLVIGPSMVSRMQQMIVSFLRSSANNPLDVSALVGRLASSALPIFAPFATVLLLATIVTGGVQTRFGIFGEKIKLSLDKLDVSKNVQNIFSLRQATLPLLILAKSAAIATVGYFVVATIFKEWLAGYPTSETILTSRLVDALQSLGLYTILLLIVLGGIDYAIQWWQREKKLKMSKDEIKEEWKQENGSPEVKQKRRQRMQQLSQMRMMDKVPHATVVITNPTTFAIALQYQRGQSAPEVVAKGKNFIAQKIRELATDNDVPLVENKPLARALYATVKVGEKIPEQFFRAVATILAHVFRQNEGRKR